MKNLNLFTKIITPIVVIGTIFAYIGFLYLNTLIEKTINHEIEQKTENKINYTFEQIMSEFKLLFYLYGTEDTDYKTQEKIEKKSVLNLLKKYNKNSSDILYIIDPNEYIKLTKKDLTSSELSTIVRTNQNVIVIDNIKYQVKQLYFKPWSWRIIYLLDTSSFEDILIKNKIALLGIVYILLFVLIILMMITFNIYIKKPIDLLLKHFSQITQGKYSTIDNIYNTKEIDLLISDVNNMTKSIEYRQDEVYTMLEITKKNESYMEDILSSQSSIIIITDTKKILDVNDSFLKFFDKYESLNDFHNQHKCVCDYFVQEDGFIYTFEDKNWLEYLIINPYKLHKVKILKDDNYYIFTIQAKESQKFDRVILTMIDITALEQSNNLLEQYKKAVDAGTIVSKTDPKGNITYANDKFVNISGYSEKELLNHNHNMVKSPNVKKEVFEDLWKTIKSKKIWSGNIENRKKDGSYYYVSATIIPILDENNNIIEYIALRYDITEQVEAVSKAQKAENTKSLFLANMSHEIRTPLNAIIGFTQILKNSSLDTKDANYINIIDQSAVHLLGIVNDILDISKIENGSLSCEKIEFNPFKEFNSVIDLFVAKADESKINLVSHIDPRILQKIIGDPLRIKQVLSNLISNALKFSKENSDVIVDIKLKSQDNNSCEIYFSVQDYGIGISSNKQKTIFEDFTQADDSTSREYGGTGLGLSISNKIVNVLGSNIEIQSEVGIGSKFYFELDYETNISNNKNLEELNLLNIGIVLSSDIKNYEFEHIKEYLEYLTNCKIYQNSDDIENLEKEDIVIVDENNIDNNIKQLDKMNKNMILVLSADKTKCEELEHGQILNIPFSRSVIFDILVSLIDKEKISTDISKESYTQFSGNILIAEDHLVNQQLISMLLDLRGIKYTIVSNGQEVVDKYKLNEYDMVLMDINMPIKNGKEATLEIMEYIKANSLKQTPIIALTANAIEVDKEQTMQLGFSDYLLKPLDTVKLDEVFTRYLIIENEITVEKEKKIISTFNLDEVSKKLGLPSMVVEKIVKSFANTIDEDLNQLKNSIENKNQEDIFSFAHKIKGAALNLRLENVSNLALKLESKVDDFKSKMDIFNILTEEIKVIQESLK